MTRASFETCGMIDSSLDAAEAEADIGAAGTGNVAR